MAPPVRVKVCGITSLEDAMAAVEAGADALGFNFHAGSRRYVTPAVAAAIVARLPPALCSVGVFVEAARAEVERIAAAVGLTALQFHGGETPAFCRGWPQKVIKGIRVRDAHAAVLARDYAVDFILADAYVEGQFGGTGARVPTELLREFDSRTLILAGGLTAANVADVVRAVRPFGVDVASGVERAPGKKDAALMRTLIANARAA